jgi:hypothetical protein
MSEHVAENICTFAVMNTKRTYVPNAFAALFHSMKKEEIKKNQKEERRILKSRMYSLSLSLSFPLSFPTSY